MDSFTAAVTSAINALKHKPKLVTLNPETKLLIIGDLHGDHKALQKILGKEKVTKRLGRDLHLVFHGDYVDRGPKSLETLTTVCNLITKHPTHVTPLRGNHEGPPHLPAQTPTFYTQVLNAYHGDKEASLHVKTLFSHLPVAAVTPGYAFHVHGHIPHNTHNLEEISQLDENNPILEELLWNDPANTPETHPSFRGHGYYVGTTQVNRFLTENHLEWIIRGHEKPPNGYISQGQTFTLHTTGEKTTYLKLPANPTKPPNKYITQI